MMTKIKAIGLGVSLILMSFAFYTPHGVSAIHGF